MPKLTTLFSRLVDVLSHISRGRDRRVGVLTDKHHLSSGIPGGPFGRELGPAKLTLGLCPRAHQAAILEATEQVTLFGSQTSGAGAVQDSLVAQQIARQGAYILFDAASDRERQDLLAHMHREAQTLADFRVLNVEDPSQSHTYNPLARGTARAVAERILTAFSDYSGLEALPTNAEFATALELVTVLVQALRDRDGVAQFRGLHEALVSQEGFQALVSSTRFHPANRAELVTHFAELITPDALRYDLDKVRKPLAQLLRLLPTFATGKLGQVLNVDVPEIDLLEGLNTCKGLYVMLPIMAKDRVALVLGRLAMSDLCDTLEENAALARGPEQPPALIVLVEAPCLATGKLQQAFAAAKAAGVGVVAGVAASEHLEHLSERDQEALLHNGATKVFFRTFANETREALWSFGHRLAIARGHGALPGMVASLINAPVGEGFLARGHELAHLSIWPQTEVTGGFERYQVPQRQPAG
jgi:hypothetical protein